MARMRLLSFSLSLTDEIMARIREAGFHIAARKETELTRDIAEQFYSDHRDRDYFSALTEHMCRYTPCPFTTRPVRLASAFHDVKEL